MHQQTSETKEDRRERKAATANGVSMRDRRSGLKAACSGVERGPEGRGRHGFGGLGRGRWERGFGGGRLFDAGDLKIVILKLLSEEPSYGYQLMKKMEERLAGGYTPSAGVIYPTLTLLEEEGLASVSTSADNKKVYT